METMSYSPRAAASRAAASVLCSDDDSATARTPRSRRPRTWSSISASSGEMTSVVPALPVRARAYCVGNWKHSDLPAPVAATASTSRRAASACSTVFWKGLKDEWPNDAFSTASADSSSQEPEEEEEEEEDIFGAPALPPARASAC